MPDTRLPSGQRIAEEISREMEDRLFPLKHVVLPPAEYYVYLHEDDYRQIEGIVPRIVLDVQMTLNARIDELNRQSVIDKFVRGARTPIEIPAGGWAIYIAPAANGDVNVGALGIEARLCVPVNAGFESGAGTTRIFHSTVDAAGKRVEGRTETVNTVPESIHGPAVQKLAARLQYDDSGEAREVILDREVTRIGRGGVSQPVDVLLVATLRVSREHCRIIRDSRGVYFIRNLSAWGTTLNGRPLARSTEDAPSAADEELTDGATIGLAGALTLTFRSW